MLDTIGAEHGSHTYKAAIEAFDSLPVEFLFPSEVSDITGAVTQIFKASEHHQVEVCVIPNPRNRSFFASVVLPRRIYTEHLRHDIQELLVERYNASYVEDRRRLLVSQVRSILRPLPRQCRLRRSYLRRDGPSRNLGKRCI